VRQRELLLERPWLGALCLTRPGQERGRLLQVPGALEVHPELGRHVEQRGQSDRRVGTDRPPPADNLVQPIERHAHAARRLDLAQPGRDEELLEQDSARRPLRASNLLPGSAARSDSLLAESSTIGFC
jgi:hypothetical protein